MHKSIFIAIQKFALKCKIGQLSKPQLATLAVGMASRLQRFSAAQVCQIITGDDGEVDYIFPGSDDELDALELHEIDEDQAGTDDDFDNLERIDQSQSRGTFLN